MDTAFRMALVRWYGRNARALPWRSKPTPYRSRTSRYPEAREGYRVWISEVMLQQTRVEAVRKHFQRFVKRFPSVRKLAAASEEAVLEAWSGLGYYRRARMLHNAARQLVANHRGRVPADMAALRALPGIGRYTAGAILSIAFNGVAPIVDGNIERVFARLRALSTPMKISSNRDAVWGFAREHVSEGAEEGHAPAVLNQALMELGAVVCTPTNPACTACPVRSACVGFKSGNPARFPAPSPRPTPRRVRYLFAAATARDGRLLLVRRRTGDASSLLPSGLWELPHVAWHSRKSAARALGDLGIPCDPVGAPLTRSHQIMNVSLTLAVQPARLVGGLRQSANRRLFTPEQARAAAISSGTRKLLDALPERDARLRSRHK